MTTSEKILEQLGTTLENIISEEVSRQTEEITRENKYLRHDLEMRADLIRFLLEDNNIKLEERLKEAHDEYYFAIHEEFHTHKKGKSKEKGFIWDQYKTIRIILMDPLTLFSNTWKKWWNKPTTN